VLELLDKTLDRKKANDDARRSSRAKPAPLTQEEVRELQDEFSQIYGRWLNGQEIEAQTELENLEVEQLRRLGDANNLNVTSKMPKPKILQLIGARFREKKQLHKGTARDIGATSSTIPENSPEKDE
jgi:hypothetical protein